LIVLAANLSIAYAVIQNDSASWEARVMEFYGIARPALLSAFKLGKPKKAPGITTVPGGEVPPFLPPDA
jgi:hypothetical protein